MVKILNIVVSLFFISLLVYIYPSSPDFPKPPSGSVQSNEPADIETPFRRAYYVNMNREEVINHYKNEFKNVFNIYTLELNYPPEEAQTLIRDQTKSSYLEELVHPLRESIYINGFIPTTKEYALFFEGKQWDQKVIVRYIPSIVWQRYLVLFVTFIATLSLISLYKSKNND